MHCGALKAISPYFAQLFSSQMSEATNERVELTTEVDDEEAFSMFIQYLYCRDYCVGRNPKQDCIICRLWTTKGKHPMSPSSASRRGLHFSRTPLRGFPLKILSLVKLHWGLLLQVSADETMENWPLESLPCLIGTIYAHTAPNTTEARLLLAAFASSRLAVERGNSSFMESMTRKESGFCG